MTTKTKPKTSLIAAKIIEQDTLEHFNNNAYEYGSLTLQDRALPDYRDGMLKVHRRIAWSMNSIAKNNLVKSARIVGDVLGKLHPHGDVAVYSSMQTMKQAVGNIVDGKGNWGSQTDDAAAYRYTNAQLSEYAREYILNPDYLPTITMHPNYDGRDEEPELLPALLPHVFLQSHFGIAVGLSTTLPTFSQESLVRVLKGMLQGRKLTPKVLTKMLKLQFPFGGDAPLDVDWQEDAVNLMKTGKASLYAYVDYEIDEKQKAMIITGVPPRMRPDTLIEKLRESGYFTTVEDCMGKGVTTPAKIVARFARNVKIADAIDELDSVLYSTIPFQIAVVERRWDEAEQKVVADIYQWGVQELLEHWLEWRLELEGKMLDCRLDKFNKEVARRNLLLLAQEHRKVIADSWEQADQVAFLMKKLKTTEDETKYIVSLRLSQLAKLDRETLKQELAELGRQVAATKKMRKDVKASVLASLS